MRFLFTVEVERKFSKERKENKKLHGKLLSMQQLIGHDLNNNTQGKMSMYKLQITFLEKSRLLWFSGKKLGVKFQSRAGSPA